MAVAAVAITWGCALTWRANIAHAFSRMGRFLFNSGRTIITLARMPVGNAMLNYPIGWKVYVCIEMQ